LIVVDNSFLNDLPLLKDVIRDHDLVATKSLGQNFLLDQNITDKIVSKSGDLSGSTVFEVGPGPGGLTRSLLRHNAKKVIAIEFDERAVMALQGLREASQGRLDIIHADALETDLLSLSEGSRVIVANLPYNIATPLLVGWLKQIRENAHAFEQMILMFQKEVAQRITAPVGDRHYGRLGILSQWLCEAHILFDLPPTVFSPPPKVTSSVVSFKPKTLEKNSPQFQSIEKVTGDGFGKRRKMIRQSMKAYTPYFDDFNILETQRAENLSIQDFVNLAYALENDSA